MRYIPGYIIKVGQGVITKSASLLDKRVKGTQDNLFKLGRNYQIYNIKPSDGKFIYTFRNDEGSFQITFDSIGDADNRIAKLVGDNIENKPQEGLL